jgi:hypothetical protein
MVCFWSARLAPEFSDHAHTFATMTNLVGIRPAQSPISIALTELADIDGRCRLDGRRMHVRRPHLPGQQTSNCRVCATPDKSSDSTDAVDVTSLPEFLQKSQMGWPRSPARSRRSMVDVSKCGVAHNSSALMHAFPSPPSGPCEFQRTVVNRAEPQTEKVAHVILIELPRRLRALARQLIDYALDVAGREIDQRFGPY